MNTIKLTYTYNGSINTNVQVQLLDNTEVTFNVSDLSNSDKQIYDSFMETVVPLNLFDYIDSGIDIDSNNVTYIYIKQWTDHGGTLQPNDELIYNEFKSMLLRVI